MKLILFFLSLILVCNIGVCKKDKDISDLLEETQDLVNELKNEGLLANVIKDSSQPKNKEELRSFLQALSGRLIYTEKRDSGYGYGYDKFEKYKIKINQLMHEVDVCYTNLKIMNTEMNKCISKLSSNGAECQQNITALTDLFASCDAIRTRSGSNFLPLGGYYFQITSSSNPWQEAKDECAADGMALAYGLDDPAKRALLTAHLNLDGTTAKSYWISGQNVVFSTSFVWDDAETFAGIYLEDLTSTEIWATGFPTGTGSQCLSLSSGTTGTDSVGLADRDCTTSINGYICEVRPLCRYYFQYINV